MALDAKKPEEQPKRRRRPKKARGHGGHHGGAWKVAYADFVTAMMALFLVLWLVSQADTKLKQSIASYFRSPGVFDTQQGGILSGSKKVTKEPDKQDALENEAALMGVAEALQQQFMTRPEFSRYKERVKIDLSDEGLKIQLLDKADDVSFQSGSADLSAEAKNILDEVAQSICSLPNKINIGGHTDSRALSANLYTNWELSADRANAARRALEAACVKPEQIRKITGYADTELLDPRDPYSPVNRRISITVLRLAADPNAKAAEPEANPKAARNDRKEPDSDESRLAKKKLLTDGAVVVGEADKVPDKPKLK
jgi:chemotaxis protein MotB